MADLSSLPKADLLRFLTSMPGAVAFEGWDMGRPKYTDAASLSNWKSAQQNPAYDEDVERALYSSAMALGPSAQQGYLKSIDVRIPRLKFMSEVSPSPTNFRGETILGGGKYMAPKK